MNPRTRVPAAILTGLAVVGLGMAVLFGGGPPPAPPRPRPPAVTLAPELAARYTPANYQAILDQDARIYGLPAISAEALGAPFPYFAEKPKQPRLATGLSTRTNHLQLSLEVTQEMGRLDGQTFRAAHLVLKIQNLTGGYLAYRVETEVGDERHCGGKGELPYNAVVLAPHEAQRRTECLLQSKPQLYLKSIEVMELPALGAMYAARISPAWAFYDARAGAGHVPPRGAPCAPTFDWRQVRDGARQGEIGWRDVIDFYARHNCDEYSFFAGYRFRRPGDPPLPARPPAAPPLPGP